MSDRKFISAERGKYSLEEEQSPGKLGKKGRSMMQKLKSFLKNWTSMIKWRNTHKKTLCEEHVAHAVREFYSDLKEAKHHDLNLQAVIILGKRCYEQLISGERSGEIDLEPSRPKYQKPGGGTKITRYPQNPKSLVANKNLQNIILIILWPIFSARKCSDSWLQKTCSLEPLEKMLEALIWGKPSSF